MYCPSARQKKEDGRKIKQTEEILAKSEIDWGKYGRFKFGRGKSTRRAHPIVKRPSVSLGTLCKGQLVHGYNRAPVRLSRLKTNRRKVRTFQSTMEQDANE